LVVNNVPYVVSGQSLYRVGSNGAGTLLGTAGTIAGFNEVDLTSDGTNVLVITNPTGYLWNGSALATVADVDFPAAARADYLDGYAIIIEPGTGRFWINETVGDWSAWNALDFATAEGWPDDTLDLIVDHRELFLFGRETIEPWVHTGDVDFPLERVPNGFIEKGVLCAGSVAKHDNTVFFPGHDGVVYRLDGYTPSRVSSHAVEQWIEELPVKQLRGMTWTEAGHAFYGLTGSDRTMVLDIATGFWHERASYGLNYWLPFTVLRAFDKWIVLDSESNRVGYLSESVFTDWGETLRSSATAPAVSDENRWVFHNRFEMIFEQGVGTAGQGENPHVMLDWSDDGGRTWSAEKFLRLGRTGEYRVRAAIHRLGRARDRVYRYAISDPVRRTLIQSVLDAEVGEH
jgi:hypothetical protein